jgi:hypothetical protein
MANGFQLISHVTCSLKPLKEETREANSNQGAISKWGPGKQTQTPQWPFWPESHPPLCGDVVMWLCGYVAMYAIVWKCCYVATK